MSMLSTVLASGLALLFAGYLLGCLVLVTFFFWSPEE